MERYVKANPKVVKHLHLQDDRTQFKDGNYLLWIQDLLPFGNLIDFQQILAQIGAVAMDGEGARDEQNGLICHPLPVATDERFIVENSQEAEDNESGGGQQEDENSGSGDGQQEATEEPGTDQKEEEDEL